jgi:probable addiction module antidote protein
MALETKVWDSADFLETPEDIAAYLTSWLEDGNAEELRAALKTIARSRGMAAIAREAKITRAGLYNALGEAGNPSFETIRAILDTMGLRLAVVPV